MGLKKYIRYQIVAILLLPALSLALEKPYIFSSSEVSSELSQQTVLEVYQDSKGFLWILTQEGLNRWDGRNNKIFSSDINIPGSISGSDMRGVVEDASGSLWFGTFGG